MNNTLELNVFYQSCTTV